MTEIPTTRFRNLDFGDKFVFNDKKYTKVCYPAPFAPDYGTGAALCNDGQTVEIPNNSAVQAVE